MIPRSGKYPGEGNATHSSILALDNPWREEPRVPYIVHGVSKSQTLLTD